MGSNSLPMKDLTVFLRREGFADVRTYIQSGNAVFRSEAGSANSFAIRIGPAVHKAKGFHPKVVVLSVKEMERAASNNPFPMAESQPKTLHLFFLSEVPLCADLASLGRLRSGKEAFAPRDKIFYLHTPDGFGVSKLAKNAERHIRVDATPATGTPSQGCWSWQSLTTERCGSFFPASVLVPAWIGAVRIARHCGKFTGDLGLAAAGQDSSWMTRKDLKSGPGKTDTPMENGRT